MSTQTSLPDDLTFEGALAALNDVVEALEAGNLPLDETIEQFERGTHLVARCQAMIARAELRVTELSATDDASQS